MFAAGTLLGTYEITGLLGSGGMGEIYRGRDTRLDRPVALKVLPAALAADPRFRQRFDREARVISRLAFEWLERAYREGDGILPMMNYARPAGPLRHDVRFGRMMRRIGLVPAPDIPAS